IGCAVDFVCRLLHLKIISLKKPLQIGLCNKAPDYYQQFYKMISLTIKIKTVHADLAGKPAGTYIVFVTVVKKDPKSNWLVTELGSGG
ncbi:hypothetical protein MJ044_06725, partial [Acinetobacter baumannii]|nr:hypothetical protein [Acinetobacter baumannii]